MQPICAIKGPQGTYFVMSDYRAVFDGTPMEFTRYLIKSIVWLASR